MTLFIIFIMKSKKYASILKGKMFKEPSIAINRLIKSVTAKTPSIKTNRNNFNGGFAKILNNFNMKKFGGKQDLDFDGVINKYDCNPFNVMRQDFSPFRQQEKSGQLSAAKRFGGQNLKGLKKIGQGRDRTVYALDKDKVLKVAKNPGGLTQNTSEKDIECLEMGKHYETGLDYTVMGKHKPLSIQNKKNLAKVRNTYHDEYMTKGRAVVKSVGRDKAPMQLLRSSERFSGEDNVLDEVGIGTDILNYSFSPDELFANRQWGEDDDGVLALNDGGALQDNNSLKKYRVKHFKQVADIDRDKKAPWQLNDWNEVQRQRREFNKKGSNKIHYPKSNYTGQYPVLPITEDVYHGTSLENAKQIATEGLKPQGGGRTSEFTDDGYIYATPHKSYAEGYARQSFGEPVLLKSKQPVGVFNKEHRRMKGSIPPQDLEITTDIPTVEEAYGANQPNTKFKQNYKKVSEFFDSDKKGASLEKQEEWQNKSTAERNYEREKCPDTDGDMVPDEYDCEPDNVMEQGFVKHMFPNEEVDNYLLSRFQDSDKYPKTIKLYHGTRLAEAKKIKKEGLKSQATTGNRNFNNIDSNYTNKTYLAQNKSNAMFWAINNKHDGESVIVEVDVPFEDYKKGLSSYKDRYNNDPMVKDEERDEILLNDISPNQIKRIIPYSNAIIEKEIRSEPSFINRRETESQKRNADSNFKIMFGASEKKQIKYNKQIPDSSNDALFGDDDGDGVLNYNDCDVNNPDEQGPWHTQQTLWHAGNKPPSQTLKDEGRVYGFSSKEYADGWKEKHDKKNIYRFTADDYVLDDKNYVRPLINNKTGMSNNEYIALKVENEHIVDDVLDDEYSFL